MSAEPTTTPFAFKLFGVGLVLLTVAGLVEAFFADTWSPGEQLGLGLGGLQAVVIAWAARADRPGQAGCRGAGGALVVVAGLATALLASVSGHAEQGRLHIGDDTYGYGSVASVTVLVGLVIVLFAAGVGVAAHRYATTPPDRAARLLWLLAATWPVVGSIEPESFTVVYPSTWNAAVIPETLLALAAAVWLAWALRRARDANHPKDSSSAPAARFVKASAGGGVDGPGQAPATT